MGGAVVCGASSPPTRRRPFSDPVEIVATTDPTNSTDPTAPAPRPEPEVRLRAALQRYDAAYRTSRPGSAGSAELARARIDLALLLEQSDEDVLPDLVRAQLERDAQLLVQVTQELPDERARAAGPGAADAAAGGFTR